MASSISDTGIHERQFRHFSVGSHLTVHKAAYGAQDHGKTSATASLGMVTLWDVEGGLPQIDKYLYSRDNHVVAGMLTHSEHAMPGVAD